MQATSTYNMLIIIVFRKSNNQTNYLLYCPSASLKIIKRKKIHSLHENHSKHSRIEKESNKR